MNFVAAFSPFNQRLLNDGRHLTDGIEATVKTVAITEQAHIRSYENDQTTENPEKDMGWLNQAAMATCAS